MAAGAQGALRYPWPMESHLVVRGPSARPGCSLRCTRPSACGTVVAAPGSLTSGGFAATSSSTASATPPRWARPKSRAVLSSLAVEGRVAASTQNQALSALLFLYRHVLHQDLPWLDEVSPRLAPDGRARVRSLGRR